METDIVKEYHMKVLGVIDGLPPDADFETIFSKCYRELCLLHPEVEACVDHLKEEGYIATVPVGCRVNYRVTDLGSSELKKSKNKTF